MVTKRGGARALGSLTGRRADCRERRGQRDGAQGREGQMRGAGSRGRIGGRDRGKSKRKKRGQEGVPAWQPLLADALGGWRPGPAGHGEITATVVVGGGLGEGDVRDVGAAGAQGDAEPAGVGAEGAAGAENLSTGAVGAEGTGAVGSGDEGGAGGERRGPGVVSGGNEGGGGRGR